MAKPRAKTVNIHEAKTNFPKLLKRVERGEEVIIARAGQPIARISRLAVGPLDRSPGSAKGMLSFSLVTALCNKHRPGTGPIVES